MSKSGQVVTTTLLLALAASIGILTGCAGNAKSTTTTTTRNVAGNWAVTMQSSSGSQSKLMGAVAQSGTSLASTGMAITGPCATSGQVTGAIQGDQISLTLTANDGTVVSLTGVASATGFTGNFSFTAGTCNGQTGTFSGIQVSDITGTYAGSITTNTGVTAQFSGSIQQSTTMVNNNNGVAGLQLSGTLNYSNLPCLGAASGSISGSISGTQIDVQNLLTSIAGAIAADPNVTFSFTGSFDPNTNTFTGTIMVNGVDNTVCPGLGTSATFVLTKTS